MTLKTVLNRLTDINQQFQDLIRDIGMDDGCELGDVLAPNKADPDEVFLINKLSSLIPPLCRLHQELSCLLTSYNDVHVLQLYPNDRYGYDVRTSDEERTFSCGSPVEALIHDENGNSCWVSTRIEHNGTDYYLYGYRQIPLNGLTIRERRCMA